MLSLLLACWLAAGMAAHAGPDSTLADVARALSSAPVSADSEQRLNAIVLDLSSRRGDPQARALLEELALREPQVFVRHEEGPAMIPLVDVGAAARAALRDWDRAAAFDAATSTMRAGRPGFVADYFAAGDNARRGMLDAVGQMDAVSLAALRNDIRDALGQPEGDALAAAAALALNDAELAAMVMAQGTDAVVQRLIARIPAAFGHTDALQLLQAAFERKAVASLALFQVATLPTKPAADTIWRSLSDPELGATAAAILARRNDRETTQRLLELMKTTRVALTRQRARLALALSADPYAQAEARNWTPAP